MSANLFRQLRFADRVRQADEEPCRDNIIVEAVHGPLARDNLTPTAIRHSDKNVPHTRLLDHLIRDSPVAQLPSGVAAYQ